MCRVYLGLLALFTSLACATTQADELGGSRTDGLTSDSGSDANSSESTTDGTGTASTTDETETESTETSTGDPGDSLGVFDITYYWVTYEGDYDPPANTDIGTCGGDTIATVPAAFASALKLEGSGKLLDDRIVNIGGCGCAGGYDCFAVLDPVQFPWGQGSKGNALVPYLSIATDTSVLPFGTDVYAPDLDGVALPNGGTHDGCLRAADVGGGINGKHFDWFVGLKGNYQTLDPNVPEQVELFQGGTICP